MKTFFKLSTQNVAILLMGLLFASSVYSQGPNTPEAGAFEPVDATDMVNLLTGDLTYVLPLLKIPSPEGGYPIALSYHAGIGIDQEASWVGLGWNLNPGAINRGVNGYPDDWKEGSIIERFYDDGGGETERTISTSYSNYGFYFAGSYSYNSNKGSGGSISSGYGYKGFGMGFTVGVQPGGKGYASMYNGFTSDNGVSFGATIGTQGVGLRAGIGSRENGSLGISYNRNFSGSDSFSISHSAKGNSLGINFSSNGSPQSFGVGFGQNINLNNSDSMVDYHVEISSKDFDITAPTPFGIFGFGYGVQKIKWEKNLALNSYVGGSYYLKDADDTYNCQIKWQSPVNDIGYFNITVYDETECSCELLNNYPKFEGYICLQATTTPINHSALDVDLMDIYEVGEENKTQSLSENNAVFPSYDNYSVSAQGLSGSMAPIQFQNGALFGLAKRKLDDQFPGQYYLLYDRAETGDYQWDYTNFTRGANFQFHNEYSTSLLIDQFDFIPTPNPTKIMDFLDTSGNNDIAPRKRSGKFVQSFTNAQILNNEDAGLIKPGELNIPLQSNTNIRGMGVLDGIGAFMITTPDGRTYHYSLPVYNHETLTRTWNINGKPERESYLESQQLKPYATHWLLTAITGPDYIDVNNNSHVDNEDYGYWVDFQYGKWSDAYVWKAPYGKEFEEDEISHSKTNSHGRKQLYYLDRIKTRTHTAIFVKNSRKIDNLSEPWVYKAVEPVNVNPNPNTFDNPKFTIPEQKTLRLDKIILIKNEDDLIDKEFGNGLEIEGNVDIDYYWPKQNEKAYYHTQDNVIDVKDNINDVMEKAIKIIDFSQHYDNELVNNSPNSLLGRLTLNGLTFLDKGGVQILPSYNFEYGDNRNFNIEEVDDWGYYKDHSATWSLTQITTPVGAKINITYEPDTYGRVAVQNGRPFTHKFKFTFITEPPKNYCPWDDIPCILQAEKGITRIKIEIDDQDPSAQGLKFSDYFDSSKPFFMDMWYSAVYNGNGSGYDRSSVDIRSEFATIVELNTIQNYMIVDVLASCPAFRDVFQHSAEPVSVLYAKGDYTGVKNKNFGRYDMAWDNEYDRAYTMRHTIIGNKVPLVDSGFRVLAISTSDDLGNELTTKYEYINPTTQESSGVISYYPFKENSEIQIPYGSLLPSPITMYEYVTVKNILGSDLNNTDFLSKTEYKFSVLEEKDPNEVKFGNYFEIDSETLFDFQGTYNNSPTTYSVNAKKIQIRDNLASLGQILQISSYNKFGHLMSKTTNEYALKNEITQGITQESFQTYKTIYPLNSNLSADRYLRLNSSSMVKYPSVLKSTTVSQGGYISKTNFMNHDPNTGQVLEIITRASDGTEYKTKSIPAYIKYGAMGSKVDDIKNKNMLVQNAVNYTFIQQNGDWKPIGVGIQTWNNNWNYIGVAGEINSPSDPDHKIWRKHKKFIWDGDIDSNGIYLDYNYDLSNDDSFDWTVDSNPDPNIEVPQPEQWKEVYSTNYYDHFSMSLEARDVNNNFVTTKMTDLESKILLTSNSQYGEAFFTGAEYGIDNSNWLEQQIFGKTLQSEEKSHTGKYSLKITSTSNFYIQLKGNTYKEGKYKLSLWAHKDNYNNIRFKDPSGIISEFNGETVMAGNWVQMNHYFDRDSQIDLDKQIKVISNSGDVYIDDIRLHPIESSMTSYIYNEFDELTFILGANNLGTKYQYDEAGRLIKIYEETVDSPTISGGFKLAKEYRYNYKGETGGGGGGGCDYTIFFSSISENSNSLPSTAVIDFTGIPGTKIYYKLETYRNGDEKALGVFNIGNDQYSIQVNPQAIPPDDNNYVFAYGETIIPAGGNAVINVSVQHISKPDDQFGNSQITIIDVDPESICINTALNNLKDEDN
ncbi:MAG TPA: hypothetical protein PKH16_00245 [Aequorivita sp.]|nr:hypothetical protein [Aequorivita sp.]